MIILMCFNLFIKTIDYNACTANWVPSTGNRVSICGFILLIYEALKESSPDLNTFPYVVLSYCNVTVSGKNLTTQYIIVLVYVVLMFPHLPICTCCDILLLMTSMTNLFISSKSSLNVYLLVNLVMLQLLKVPNTGQYVKFTTGW